DPSTHRRINPNYPISLVRPKDHDVVSEAEDSDDSSDCCECGGGDSDGTSGGGDRDGRIKYVTKVIQDTKGEPHVIRGPKDEEEDGDDEEGGEKATLDKVEAKREETGDGSTATPASEESDKTKQVPEFTDEEYLIASPVVLGFAFAEKLWLEFTVSGIKDI